MALIVLDIDLPDLPEIVRYDEGESNPLIVFVRIEAKDHHEKDQLSEQGQLEHRVVPQETNLAEVLQVPLNRLATRVFSI